jgi:MFS family permease
MPDERVEQLKRESLPELLRELSMQATTLVRQEIDLAKSELSEKAKALGTSAGLFGGAAVLGLGAFFALTTCIIAGIALVLPLWAAALIVAIVYAIIALIIVSMGKRKLMQATPVVPQQTAQSLKEDVEWVKTRAQSSKRSN